VKVDEEAAIVAMRAIFAKLREVAMLSGKEGWQICREMPVCTGARALTSDYTPLMEATISTRMRNLIWCALDMLLLLIRYKQTSLQTKQTAWLAFVTPKLGGLVKLVRYQ
jgi:hypothetical protein